MSEEERYFIIERDRLTELGFEAGMSKAEAENQLAHTTPEDDLVVIKGVVIEPKVTQRWELA